MPPAPPRRGRGGTSGLLEYQGLRTALPEGSGPTAYGVGVPSQCLRRGPCRPALRQQPDGVPAFTLPWRGRQNHPPVQILGTHLPLFKMLNHLPHTHHQPLSRPGTSQPSAPQIYPIPLRISPRLWFSSGFSSPLSVPVYLGDSLQLRTRAGELFSEREVAIEVQDERNTRLVFPVSLVERAEDFDALMSDVADAIETSQDPLLALDDNGISDEMERSILEATIGEMQKLHGEGRDHIWAYYTRNLVRPVALSRTKVDVIIGNPPWINYNQTADVLRRELERQSKERYGIWVGGENAGNQEVAGLFFAQSVALYLNQGGVIGFVMPHSTLQSGQHAKWRTGLWQSPPKGRGKNRTSNFIQSVEFDYKLPWDLERLEPRDFFPVPGCVVFARNAGQSGVSAPLAGQVEGWHGQAGSADVRRLKSEINNSPASKGSAYADFARRGGDVFPRCLFFINETKNPATVQKGNSITVTARRGGQDHAPWKELDLTKINNKTVSKKHLFEVFLNESLAPYVTLEPLLALLPFKQGEYNIAADDNGFGGLRMGSLDRSMRERWSTISELWWDKAGKSRGLNLVGNLDRLGKLSSQLQWQSEHGTRPFRVLQSEAGEPTAAILEDEAALVDTSLYWISCRSLQEAHFLLAIINSSALFDSVVNLMPKGQFGARHLHKHLWKLPIPEYDANESLHLEISQAGVTAAAGAAKKLEELRAQRGEKLTVKITRRDIREWLSASPEGKAVEDAVSQLLSGGS